MNERIERLAFGAADAEAWSEEIEARAGAERIVSEAKARASEIIARAEHSAGRWLSAERAKRLGEAHSRVLEDTLTVKHRAVKKAVARARQLLDEMRRDRDRYAPVLEGLIIEAARGIRNPIVEVAPGDLEMAEAICRKHGIKGEVRPSSWIDAGAVVRDTERGLSVYNTFSERLAKAAEILLSHFGEVFGAG